MSRVRAGVGVLVLGIAFAACGRVSRDPIAEGPDAGIASASAGGAASACDPGKAGTLTWARTFEQDSDASFPSGEAQGLVQCGDGLCTVADGVLIKFSTAGAMVWSRTITGDLPSHSFTTKSLAADARGDLILGGYCTGQPTLTTASGVAQLPDCGDEPTHPQVMLVRLDPDGFFVSAETLGTSVDFPPPIRVAAAPDGRHIAFTLAGDGTNAYASDGLVVAWAADGTESYRHVFSGGFPVPTDIAFDSQGNAVLVGFFYKTTSVDENDPDGGTLLDTAGSEICVVKLTPTGELAWGHCFGGDPQEDLEPELALGPDDSIFLAGSFIGHVDFDAIGQDAPPSPTRLTTIGSTALPQPDSDLYVTKLTADGDFVWQRDIGNTLAQDGPYGLAVTPAGQVLFDAVTRGPLDVGPFHFDGGTSGGPFLLELAGNGDPVFLTSLGTSTYFEAHAGIALGSCSNFYLIAYFEGALSAPGANGGDGLALVGGNY